MKQNAPDVCVIIAARNSASTIGRAVRSALRQDHVSEVIVVDDASSDATMTAALDCDDGGGRLKVVAFDVNQGPAAARNHALALATSSHVMVLDADDYMLQGRVAKLLSRSCSEWDFIADDIIVVLENAAETDLIPVLAKALPISERISLETFVQRNVSDAKRARSELGFLKPLMSRQFLLSNGLKYRENLRLGEDYALYVEALLAGADRSSDRIWLCSRRQGNSLSHRHSTSDLFQMVAFDDVILAGGNLKRAERDAFLKHRRATWMKFVHSAIHDRKCEAGYLAGLRLLTHSPAANSLCQYRDYPSEVE